MTGSVVRTFAAMLVVASSAFAQGDADSQRVVEAASLEVDARAGKLMSAVREQFRSGEWDRGVERLREIGSAPEGRLVRIGPRRYASPGQFVNLVAAGLPAEGRAAYRRAIDPAYRDDFERGVRERDERVLQRIVDEAFVSSHTDEALWLLGELAFARGDTEAAREHWSRLLPLPGEFVPGDPLPRLRYPDSDIAAPRVLAHLVAVSIAEGRLARARREFESFAERHPDAEGQLAGREGPFVDRLAELIEEAGGRKPIAPDAISTFGGAPSRQHVAAPPDFVARPGWSAPRLPSVLVAANDRPALPDPGPATVHSLLWRDVLLTPAEDRILARDVLTGRPWPDPEDTPVLYRMGRPLAVPREQIDGVPRFTLTLADGRLFARLGSPVTGIAERELADVESEIVCLDLERAEGRLLARITAGEAMGGEPKWAFESAPLVTDGRVYAILRRVVPQTEIAAVCLELRPVGRRGYAFRLVWRSNVCAALQHVPDNRNVITSLLPAADSRRLFVATDFGVVVALDLSTGDPVWATTYPSDRVGSADDEQSGPDAVVPPVVHDGRLFVAPNDSRNVLAIDAAEGFVRWSRPLPDRVRHVLGVGSDRVVVSGDSLWGLDVRSGAVVWAKRRFDPESFGHGRGQLVGSHVWWPTRTGIAVVRHRDGRPSTDPATPFWIDLEERGLHPGNLVVGPRRLAITGSRSTTSLSPAASAENTP